MTKLWAKNDENWILEEKPNLADVLRWPKDWLPVLEPAPQTLS